MVNKRLMTIVTVPLLMSFPAIAADLPASRAPVYGPPPPVFSWTGFYVGGQIGYEFGLSDRKLFISANGALIQDTTKTLSGVIGGAHAGYNFAVPNSSFVLGVEGDVDGVGIKGYAQNATTYSKLNDPVQGSVRGRAGYAIDRALFYATGGAAFGSFKNTYGVFTPALSDSTNVTRVGYTVGGGLEYIISGNWSVRAEYRYTDFGTFTTLLPNTAGGAAYFRHTETQQRAQAGFSYKFDSPLAPVVARY